jgi:hypothetical protein
VLSHQDGHHSAVALLLKAALIQVSDYRLLGASAPQKSLIVNYIGKISNIKPYVPLLDLNVNIGWLSLPVRFRRE